MTTHQVTAKEEAYRITNNEEIGLSSRDVLIDALNRDQWGELYRFQVPEGISYIFEPHHRFSIYGEYLSDPVDLGLADDGGSFTDETTDVNDVGAGDITLMPATEAINDAYYFGQRYPFGRLRLTIGTQGVSSAKDLAWEYYTGSAWAAVPGLTDASTAFTAGTSTYNIDFTPPADWARTTVDGKDAFWLRAKIVTADYTTVAVGSQAFINGGSFELRDADLIKVELQDANRQGSWPLLAQRRYGTVKEFTLASKIAHLDIGERKFATSGMWVIVSIRPTSGIVDVSNSFFGLDCLRVRLGMFR